MMLVDNFRIILLVGLICAAGLRSTDAAATKCFKGTASEACDADKTKCKSDSTGMLGCVVPDECAATSEETYCCEEDDCNDIKTKKEAICKMAKKVKGCGGKLGRSCEEVGNEHEVKGCKEYKVSFGGAAGTYGGISIPIVTLVSAFLYYIPLNFFL